MGGTCVSSHFTSAYAPPAYGTYAVRRSVSLFAIRCDSIIMAAGTNMLAYSQPMQFHHIRRVMGNAIACAAQNEKCPPYTPSEPTVKPAMSATVSHVVSDEPTYLAASPMCPCDFARPHPCAVRYLVTNNVGVVVKVVYFTSCLRKGCAQMTTCCRCPLTRHLYLLHDGRVVCAKDMKDILLSQ
jgi:hypothetical protein